MLRIDDRTVELTDEEQTASGHFNTFLDMGSSILDAGAHIRRLYPDLDPTFYEWLEA